MIEITVRAVLPLFFFALFIGVYADARGSYRNTQVRLMTIVLGILTFVEMLVGLYVPPLCSAAFVPLCLFFLFGHQAFSRSQ